MTDLEKDLRILFEVFERLHELFSREFSDPVAVSLPFERPTRNSCIGFIGRVNEIRLKRETCDIDVFPKRNWVSKEELQCVSLNTLYNIYVINENVSQHLFPSTRNEGTAKSILLCNVTRRRLT